RDRSGHHRPRARAGRRPRRHAGCVHERASCGDHIGGGPKQRTSGLCVICPCQRRRLALLGTRTDRPLSSRPHPCGSHPARREAGRSPGAVSDKIRDGREPQDRQGARSFRTTIDSAARNRGVVPAFVMSGDTAPERLREARASGLHLLHKPVQPMKLRAMLSQFLAKSQPVQGLTVPPSSIFAAEGGDRMPTMTLPRLLTNDLRTIATGAAPEAATLVIARRSLAVACAYPIFATAAWARAA